MTKTSRFGWVFGVLGAWASYAGLVIAPGCGATDTNGGGTDSNTHWLAPCDDDSDCGGLSCVCGVCTEQCEDDDACSDLPGASCALANTCSAPSCVVECRNDGDCGAVGAGFECADGQCEHRSSAAAGSGGQGPGEAGQAGAPLGAVAGNGGSGGVGVGGTGGSAGSGATAGAGAPSTGGMGPTGPCAAMDVKESGLNLPCLPGAPTYYWDGDRCAAFNGCVCEGEDCDERYPTMAACDVSYATCYEQQGITGACEADADCKLTFRGCCQSCGTTTIDMLAATNAEEEALWHDCGAGGSACPPCIPGELSQEGVAACVEGRCQVQSRCESVSEAACEADELCEPVYARLPGETDEVFAGCRYSGPDAVSCADEPPSCGIISDSAADAACVIFDTTCRPRNYFPLDCASTACQAP